LPGFSDVILRYLSNDRRAGLSKPLHDGLHRLNQRFPVLDLQRVRFDHRLRDGQIALARALIGPDEHIAQQLDLVEFIHPQRRLLLVKKSNRLLLYLLDLPHSQLLSLRQMVTVSLTVHAL
jgi:hypothetical protein